MWGERIINEYPNFSFVGEEWSNDPSMVAYWQRGSKRYDSYVSYVPCMMDFPLQQALINALLSKDSRNSGLIDIYKILASDYVYGNPYDLVVFAGNHDIKIFNISIDVEQNWTRTPMELLKNSDCPCRFLMILKS